MEYGCANMGDGGMHQHECEQEVVIDNLQKQVEKLNEYPQIISVLANDVQHMKTTMDSVCFEMKKLNVILEKFAVAQTNQEHLKKELEDLIAEMRNSHTMQAKCQEACDTKMLNMGARVGGCETRLNGVERKFDKFYAVYETLYNIAKWVAVLVIGAIILWGLSNIGRIFTITHTG